MMMMMTMIMLLLLLLLKMMIMNRLNSQKSQRPTVCLSDAVCRPRSTTGPMDNLTSDYIT